MYFNLKESESLQERKKEPEPLFSEANQLQSHISSSRLDPH